MRISETVFIFSSFWFMTACEQADHLGKSQENQDVTAGPGIDVNSTPLDWTSKQTLEIGKPGDPGYEVIQVIEGDIEVDSSILDIELHDRQYHTTHLVTGSTIKIVGSTERFTRLPTREREALEEAVDDYNALGLDIEFELQFKSGAPYGGIFVGRNRYTRSRSGGIAGFPRKTKHSGTLPHDEIKLFDNDEFSYDVLVHVIKHEIGHCIGLRHNDWMDRRSCSTDPDPERQSPPGAIHIPGTDLDRDGGSVMNACFSRFSRGRFSPDDITALRYMY